MRIPHGLRSALASQGSQGGQGGSSSSDQYFSDVSLLLYGDGTNGSTAIVDSSSNAHTMTAAGNLKISTVQSKFGGTSMLFDGNGDFVTAPVDTSFEFGTGDFTVELWAYISSLTAGNYQRAVFIALGLGGVGGSVNPHYYGWGLHYTPGTLYFDKYDGTYYSHTFATTLSFNTWYHIAVTRSGTSLRCFVDGGQVGTTITTSVSFNRVNTDPLVLGYWRTGSAGSSYDFYHGFMDDVRVTKGVARYTSNFTPPTASFSTLTPGEPYFYNNSLLLHGDGTNGSKDFIDSTGNNIKYASSSAYASNGVIPNGGTPYWVDILPLNTNIHYFSNFNGMELVHTTGNTAYVFWHNTPAHGVGRVERARFDLRDFPTVTSVRIDAQLPHSDPYTVRLLDSSKNVISNTSIQINGARTFYTVPVAGSPAFIEFISLGGANDRLYLFGIEVNGTVLLNHITVGGNAIIRTDQSKFGGASMYFDNSGDYLLIPSSTKTDFGTSDFTIEAWIRPSAVPGVETIVSQWNGNGFYFAVNGAKLKFAPYINAAAVFVASSTTTIAVDTWYHAAVTRDGNTFRLFVNGVLEDTVTNTVSFVSSIDTYIGRWQGYSRDFGGYIDDLRITKGVARYTASFTPPTSAFPNP